MTTRYLSSPEMYTRQKAAQNCFYLFSARFIDYIAAFSPRALYSDSEFMFFCGVAFYFPLSAHEILGIYARRPSANSA